MIIVLMGYMGSGKSTIGKELATILNYEFLDLDDFIVDKEKASINDIFKEKGEIYFRRKESEYLNELITSPRNLVLSLGGGTPCYGNNMDVLVNNVNTMLFYLKLSIPQLVERLFKEREQRPLISHLNSKEELTDFIGKHLFERAHYYNMSPNIINADNKSKQETIENIITRLI